MNASDPNHSPEVPPDRKRADRLKVTAASAVLCRHPLAALALVTSSFVFGADKAVHIWEFGTILTIGAVVGFEIKRNKSFRRATFEVGGSTALGVVTKQALSSFTDIKPAGAWAFGLTAGVLAGCAFYVWERRRAKENLENASDPLAGSQEEDGHFRDTEDGSNNVIDIFQKRESEAPREPVEQSAPSSQDNLFRAHL